MLTVRCTEISSAGMKLEIAQPQQVNSFGKVSVSRQGHIHEFRARFAHVEKTQAGLDLICNSDTDRKAMADLLDSVIVARGGRVRTA
jgi:hypothetical protein